MEESVIKKHVTLVAALQIGFSALGIIGSLIIFFIFSFAGSFVVDDEVATMVLKFIGSFLPLIIFLASLVGLTGGIGLLSYKKWARVLVLVVAAIGCVNFPLGTLKGVYSFWVLMQDESIKLFT
jgi:O-antigen/teichoic acid export membrane protein